MRLSVVDHYLSGMTTQIDHIKAELSELHGLMTLTPEADWILPTACGGFAVRDVVGHLVASRRMPMPEAAGWLALHGLRLNAAAYRVSRREGKRPIEQLLTGLADAAVEPRSKGLSRLQPLDVMLADVVTHHEDIRWGLGLRRTMPTDLAHDVLSAAVRLRGLGTWGTRRRAKGVSLHAVDVDWRWGQGPLVSGTADALLLGLGGRHIARVDLRGDGVPRLTR